MWCPRILIRPLVSFIFVSHDAVIVNAGRRYITKCCDLLSRIFGLMHGSDSHQKSAGKQIPAIVFPPRIILIKALLGASYIEVNYNDSFVGQHREIAPLCFCTRVLGVLLVRREEVRCVSWLLYNNRRRLRAASAIHMCMPRSLQQASVSLCGAKVQTRLTPMPAWSDILEHPGEGKKKKSYDDLK